MTLVELNLILAALPGDAFDITIKERSGVELFFTTHQPDVVGTHGSIAIAFAPKPAMYGAGNRLRAAIVREERTS
jgi:hypothetical protein